LQALGQLGLDLLGRQTDMHAPFQALPVLH
jgi:hypothetical protein